MSVASEYEPIEPRHLGAVRAGGLSACAALVRELGCDPAALIARGNLPAHLLDEADNLIPFAAGGRLLQLAARATACAHLGLLLGLRQDLASLGLLGALAQHCADVRTALAQMVTHMHVQDTGAVATLTQSGGVAALTYRLRSPDIVGAEQIYHVSIAASVRFLQGLLGAHWRPQSVQFCTPAPDDARAFCECFDAPVHFDQPISAVCFPAEMLDHPIADADPQQCASLLERVHQIEAQRRDDVVLDHVTRVLLSGGRCTAECIAELFGIHRRTMHRILARQATTFEQVLDGVRRDIAMRALAQPDVRLARLSKALGYRCPSAFTRAFRRWTAQSPSEWQTPGRPRRSAVGALETA